MTLTDTALRVLTERYFIKDEAGIPIEDWDALVRRVANAVAESQRGRGGSNEHVANVAREYYDLIHGMDFLPNSPTLMNAGTPMGQLSACFLIDVRDDMSSIFDAVKDMAMIFKSGGGVGIPLSALREEGALVRSTGGKSSGPISFMRVYNTVAEVVSQGGKRRGALMATLRVDHPDIEKFITCKQKTSEFTCFNISVMITKRFMSALKVDETYEVIDPQTYKPVGTRSAREVWDLIVRCAHQTGEPGLVFIDRINEYHRKEVIDEPVVGTNPCGELPLRAYESCNLGSINLSHMVHEVDDDPIVARVNWDKLKKTAWSAVRFLDDVIDVNVFPLDKIKERTLETRKIGLGVMGLAEMLAKLKIPYGSQASFDLVGMVMQSIREAAVCSSRDLADSLGAYPASTVIDRRNGTLMSIAPTGSISMIAGVTGGIEPFFAPVVKRQGILGREEFFDTNPYFNEMLTSIDQNEAMRIIVALGDGASMEEAGVPESISDCFVCAHEVKPRDHVIMQSIVQEHVDNAVSKTVNLPNGATQADIEEIFTLAYDRGCKGITVYRDGCREHQPMTTGKKEDVVGDGSTGDMEEARKFVENMSRGTMTVVTYDEEGYVKPDRRPDSLPGITCKVKTGCGTLFVTISLKDGKPIEIFAHHGKAGVCSQAQCEAIGRLTSMGLRSHLDPKEIAQQLRGITCHQPFGFGEKKVLSCGDGIAKVLLEVLGEPAANKANPIYTGSCPECGGSMKSEGNCYVCTVCGYEKCS